MTEPIDPAELSALIDGELPPDHVREIEAALARDPALRADYEALRALDAGWRQAAGKAVFVPRVRIQAPSAALPWPAAVVLVLLLLARIGGKFVDAIGPSLLLNLAALAVIAWALLAAARAERIGPLLSARPE